MTEILDGAAIARVHGFYADDPLGNRLEFLWKIRDTFDTGSDPVGGAAA